MKIVITGIGLRSALGNLTESWQALLQGKSGLSLHQPFSQFAPIPLGLMASLPSTLPPLVAAIAQDALQDAQLVAPLEDCGVVVGSSRGCQGIWEQWASSKQPVIENWLETLPHQASLLTADQIGRAELILSPMAACATGIWAIAQGCQLIQQGRCQRVLAGAVEVPITPLTLAGFQQMGALAKTGCYPFDQNREGLVLGEGGAVFVLESLELAQKRGAKIYGTIKGWGFTCDASHVSAPAEDNHSASLAIKHCLERSDLTPHDIQFIHAHGTGTQLNDRREAALIQAIFPEKVAVSSSKGATGHTLGASGALGIGFSLMALHSQLLPPCVGLNDSDFGLNFVKYSQSARINHALCLSFGFGGQNAAIALSA
jgi:3-oxoacyl-[acyl-carrier-protein] synthase II